MRVLNAKPAGNDGEIDHDVAGEPLFIGVTTVIALFATKLYEVTLKDTSGGFSATVSCKFVVELPAELVAVTV